MLVAQEWRPVNHARLEAGVVYLIFAAYWLAQDT